MIKIAFWGTILSVLMFIPTTIFGEAGQRFKIDGYSLHVSATRLSNSLIVRGSISGGENSNSLKIYCYLVDENGRTDRVTAVIKRYSHSDKFSLKKKINKSAGNRWQITDVRIYR